MTLEPQDQLPGAIREAGPSSRVLEPETNPIGSGQRPHGSSPTTSDRWPVLVAVFLLTVVVIVGSLTAPSEALLDIELVEGHLTDSSGAPVSGLVEMFAWPSEEYVMSLESGTEIPTVSIASVEVAENGWFSLRYPAEPSRAVQDLITAQTLDIEVTAFLETGDIVTTFLVLEIGAGGEPMGLLGAESGSLPVRMEMRP